MKLLTNYILIVGVIFALQMGSCKYDVFTDSIVTETVSFRNDVIPIFNQSCNSAGCHNAGGIKPDLSPANAYDALISGGYIDNGNPENSELYLWMRGDRRLPMPLSGPNASYNSIVLAWISQGAQNN
jgi:hypothetical protein